MSAGDPRWQLEPAGGGTRAFAFAVSLLLPIGITLGAVNHAFGDALPHAGGNGAMTAWLTVAGVSLVSLAIWWVLLRALRRHRIVLADGAIDIATSFYRRRLAIPELRLDEARAIDLDERTEFKPMLKTNGVSMPGFRSGWFRLRNRDRALVATAGGKRVAWIPTRAGYGLLLQPRNPQALLDALRKMADAAPRR